MALVCLCYGVNERRIVREIDQGARSIADITERCRAGGCCMSCHDTIDELIVERSSCPLPGVRVSLA
ncbi:(2Fe-2S)-binding protein [Desertimonas flava]|jgi:bacterioferritin-associated ferredoxin|uniref:(2Fe-2S)-binding protein n=1 Tax=Desertimonas flava TaxID=2064846 RepID=UPI000E34CCD4|nr:(2Fe-2S)-binding protein [Desertimonas flava]